MVSICKPICDSVKIVGATRRGQVLKGRGSSALGHRLNDSLHFAAGEDAKIAEDVRSAKVTVVEETHLLVIAGSLGEARVPIVCQTLPTVGCVQRRLDCVGQACLWPPVSPDEPPVMNGVVSRIWHTY